MEKRSQFVDRVDDLRDRRNATPTGASRCLRASERDGEYLICLCLTPAVPSTWRTSMRPPSTTNPHPTSRVNAWKKTKRPHKHEEGRPVIRLFRETESCEVKEERKDAVSGVMRERHLSTQNFYVTRTRGGNEFEAVMLRGGKDEMIAQAKGFTHSEAFLGVCEILER
ncbi:hypothetical protein K458DRAFT_408291 [Lentithecium fluviatile CBS 122367]|uniref:Uncharacterized protein n=1 Tax=Lentithecium fluviatile CBS 122367 TaxID=1168545 RepID=A0A6G1IMN3_9PLEO|nr:hypothetical protein K458DRAFT_408291 [Lentithecium fluviatile CBS 122367]